MKKILFFVIVVTFLASCQEQSVLLSEADVQNSSSDLIFTASFEKTQNQPDTKVFAGEDLSLFWNANDRITIFNKYTNGNQYVFLGNDGDKNGNFQVVSDDLFVVGNELDHVYAVYPYREETYITNDGEMYVTLPANQTYKKSSFGDGVNAMVSVADDNELFFRNLGGFLSLKLYGEGISVSSITLQGNQGEALAGQMKVTVGVDGIPTMENGDNIKNTLTLTCSEPVDLGRSASDYTEFWFVVPPVTFSNGFSIKVIDSNGYTFEQSVQKSVSVERNHIVRMAPIEVIPFIPEWQYLLDPTTGQVATVHWTQGWWGQEHTSTIKYYELNGVRTCIAECDEGNGIWGDDVNTTIQFTWYTENTNSDGYQLIAIPKQYLGFDYSDWSSKPEGDAVNPIYLYDYYTYWIQRGESLGSFLEFAANSGDIDGGYPVSYYDGNGGFMFNARYYIPGIGGFNPDPYELKAVVDGFNRVDFNVAVGIEDNEVIPITFMFSPSETVRYAIYPGFLKNGVVDARVRDLAENREESAQNITTPGTIYLTGSLLTPGDYTLVAILLNERGMMKKSTSCTFRFGVTDE